MASKCLTKNNLSVLDWGGESSDSNELCTIGYAINHFNAERKSGSYQDTSLYPDNRIVTGHMEGGPHRVPNEIEKRSVITTNHKILNADIDTDQFINQEYDSVDFTQTQYVTTEFIWNLLNSDSHTYSLFDIEVTNGTITSVRKSYNVSWATSPTYIPGSNPTYITGTASGDKSTYTVTVSGGDNSTTESKYIRGNGTIIGFTLNYDKEETGRETIYYMSNLHLTSDQGSTTVTIEHNGVFKATRVHYSDGTHVDRDVSNIFGTGRGTATRTLGDSAYYYSVNITSANSFNITRDVVTSGYTFSLSVAYVDTSGSSWDQALDYRNTQERLTKVS